MSQVQENKLEVVKERREAMKERTESYLVKHRNEAELKAKH